MQDSIPSAAEARCPRCGYDQRGVMEAWQNSCPREGVCAECGLTFSWPEILHPEKFEPRWCVEFAEPVRRTSLIAACVKTWARSLWPWAFWPRIRMSYTVRGRRLMAYTAFLLAPLLVLYVFLQGGMAIHVRYRVQVGLEDMHNQLPGMIAWDQRRIQNPIQSMPGFSETERQAQVDMAQQMIAIRKPWVGKPPIIDHSYAEAVVEAIVFPLAADSWGSTTTFFGTRPYVPPRTLLQTMLRETVPRSARTWMRFPREVAETGRAILIALGLGSMVTVLMPASFVVLPVSRRRAKVRWAHLGRVTVYSLVIPLGIPLVCAVAFTLALFTDSNTTLPPPLWPVCALLVEALCLMLWWWAAIRCYMLIPHAFLTSCLLTLLCLLLPLAAIWLMAN